MKYKSIKYIVLICFMGAGFIHADDTGISEDSRKELQTLQKEIDRYERQLSKKRKDEKSAANLIASLDRKIDLTSNVLYELRRQVQKNDHEIRRLEREIEQLRMQIEQLRDIIKRRLVSFYKYGRRRDFELLFAGGSWQKVDVWLRYEKLVARNDMRNFRSLISKKQQLEDAQRRLQRERTQRQRALTEKQRRAEQLKQSRAKRQKYLYGIRKDRHFLQRCLEELASAQEQIKGFISRSERLRIEKERQISHQNIVPKPLRDYSFATMKGRLPWPTTGQIVSHFGRQRHPTLKTVTENLGIEIKAPLGSPVKAVDAGQVETITWQRGRGNIIIISHDEGYYTVYTNLAEIRVNVMDQVSAGQVIGTVGDAGSLSGPVLHFQIWKNTKNLNPEDWLG